MNRTRDSIRFAALVAAVAATAPLASAGTLTWTGAVSNVWNTTDANWTGDALVYTSQDTVSNAHDGDDVIFTDNFTGPTNITMTTADNLNPNSITFVHIPGSTPVEYSFTGSPFGSYFPGTQTSLTLDTGFLGKVILLSAANGNGRGFTTIRSGTLELRMTGTSNAANALPTLSNNNNRPGDVELAGGILSMRTGSSSSQLDGNLNVTEDSELHQSITDADLALQSSFNFRVWGTGNNSQINISSGKKLTVNPNAGNVTGTYFGVTGAYADIGANMAGSLGTLTLGNNSGIIRFVTANRTGPGAIYDTGTNGGIFRLQGSGTHPMGALTGAAGTRLEGSSAANSATTLQVGAKQIDTTFAGVIADGGENGAFVNSPLTVTKAGINSTLTLTGANTYSGDTNIVGSTLKVGHASALGSPKALGPNQLVGKTAIQGTAAVQGTLDLNGFSLSTEPITMTGGNLTNSSATDVTISADSLAGFKVTNGGSGYSGVASLSVDGNASAIPLMGLSNGSFTLVNGGSRYRGNASGATITGDGVGASVAISYGMTSESFTVTAAGSGYTPNAGPGDIPVTFSAPTNGNPAIPNIQAEGYATTNELGEITGIVVTNPGSGYVDTGITATVAAPDSGTQATFARVNLPGSNRNWFQIVGLYLTNPGVGFTSTPTITLPAPVDTNGVQGTADANFDHNIIAGVLINSLGSGYNGVAPTVTVNGTGSGATVEAVTPYVILNEPPAGVLNTIGGNAGDITIDIGITGSGGFSKVGTNTLTLRRDNAFTGAIDVVAGTLALEGGSLATGNVTVQSGATFSMDSSSSITFNITPAESSEQFVGLAGSSVILDGTLVINIAGVYDNGAQWDLFDLVGAADGFDAVELAGDYVASLVESAGLWTGIAGGELFEFNEANGVLRVVPEPATLGMVAAAGLIALRRRRHSLRSGSAH